MICEANIDYFKAICLNRVRRTTRNLHKDSWQSGENLKPVSSKIKAGVTILLLKRVLKYLNTTKDVGIVYFQNDDQLEGFSDADWGGNLDRRSFSGFVFKLSGAAIHWRCKKQRTIALSTTEAEYMTLSETTKEVIFLRKLWFEICNEEITIPIFCHNCGALAIAKIPVNNDRTKHIGIRVHFIRERVESKELSVDYIPGNQLFADGCMKGLNARKHTDSVNSLGLC
jgi:hypothetical protein